MASPYLTAGAGSSGGSPYASAGSGSTAAPPAPKRSGGILGTIGHVISQGASDLEHAAINAPAGIAKLAVDAVHSPWLNASGGWQGALQQWEHPLRPVKGDPVGADVQGMIRNYGETAQHPLRHPGYTLLNYLPVASAAARAGELATGASLATRTLRSGDLTVNPEASRSAIGRVTQKASDVGLQKLAAKRPGGTAENLLNRKIGKTINAEAKQTQRNAAGPGQALIAMGRKLKPEEQKALQVVAEEAPLKQRITTASARVIGSKTPLARAGHQAELDLLHKAQAHLGEEAGKPVLAGPQAAKLGAVLGKMRTVAGDRETLLKGLGLLTDEAAAGRKTSQGRIAIGATYTKPTPLAPAAKEGTTLEQQGQLSLAPRTAAEQPAGGITGAEHFTASPEAVRIPDVATRKGSKALTRMGSVGAQGTIGHLRAPGSVTHEYTGALRENALRRQDTTRLVGESSLEAAKYAGLKHVHELVRKAVQPAPTRPDDVAVRLASLKPHATMPLEVRKFLSDPEEHFATATPAEHARMIDQVRQRLFMPTKNWQPAKGVNPDTQAEFERLHAAGKVGWVPKRMLGELGNPSAPLRAVAPGKAVGTVDAINNASRFAILYLKPAYAIPNILGNAALSIVQQGWAAPRNLAQAARLVQRLPEEDYARIDASMGEGVARAVSAHNAGRFARTVDFAAGKWSKAVDTPFRRASFLHEARTAGYRTPAQIHTLLHEDTHQPALIRVGIKANRDAIDYENLSPTEKEIVRRVVFFYPWVKGSTVYSGRFLREHPAKAAVAGQLGREGQQYSQQSLGPAPSYLEGLIPFGKDRAFNPTSAAILQTPAQVGEAAQGLLSGNIPEAAQLTNFATPAVSLAMALQSRKNAVGVPYKQGQRGIGHVAMDTLGSGLPQVSLYRAIHSAVTGQGGSKLYPPSVSGALGQFFLGGAFPRKIDRNRLNALAASEQSRIRTGR